MTPRQGALAAKACFLRSENSSGYRFALHHEPRGSVARSVIVFAHALGEEMNKSRRMAAMAARALAEAGHAVLQIDLLGCGDSSGDHADATWGDWLADLRQAISWMCSRHGTAPLVLWGHRAGCLLIAELAQSTPATLLFWQPPASGKALLQQLVRLKITAGLGDREAKSNRAPSASEVSRSVRSSWQEGRTVEIAGYDISPALADGLEAARLAHPTDPTHSYWLEVSSREGGDLLPATAAARHEWLAAGHHVDVKVVSGPAFWSTLEVEDAPALLQATVEALEAIEEIAGLPDQIPQPACAQLPHPMSTVVTLEFEEQALPIACAGESLLAVLTMPVRPCQVGVVIVVGGPQYRVGSHRQFVQLARALARAGYAALRFDVRGMGDATGGLGDFDRIGPDIAAAVTALAAHLPAEAPIVIWGLCDGASAALLYLHERKDPRVAGLVLANPWARSDASLARAQVKHYYTRRVLEREFWRKLVRGGIGLVAVRDLLANLVSARSTGQHEGGADGMHTFQRRMAAAYATFKGPVLLLLSGQDITAREFEEFAANDDLWQATARARPPQQVRLPASDHTFSQVAWRQAAEDATLRWLSHQVLECPA